MGTLMGRYVLKIETNSEATSEGSNADNIEKRKHARVPICVPISCVSIDSESMPLDHNMGIIEDVSQIGVGIEANNDVCSDRLILTFVDLNNNIAQITGKVVFSKKSTSGTYKIGALLQGKQLDSVHPRQ